MSIITVAYSPNDFFYTTSNVVPSKEECTVQYSDASWNDYWKSMCNDCHSASVNPNFTGKCDLSWNDISDKCYKFQLCHNREMATLANKQQNNNSGFSERYANAQKQYDFTLLETVNLVVGIGLITYFTVYSFSVK